MTDVLFVSGQSNANPNFYRACQAQMGPGYVSGHFNQSGASIANWIDLDGSVGFNWAPMLAEFDSAIQSASGPIEDIYFVWFQGEGDTIAFNNYEKARDYEQRLRNFIVTFSHYVKQTYNKEVHFSLALVWVTDGENQEGFDRVRESVKRVGLSTKRVGFYETKNAYRVDNVHLQNNVFGGSAAQIEVASIAIHKARLERLNHLVSKETQIRLYYLSQSARQIANGTKTFHTNQWMDYADQLEWLSEQIE